MADAGDATLRADARRVLEAALEAADAEALTAAALEPREGSVGAAGRRLDPEGVHVAALGKAAPAMGRALAEAFPEAPGVSAVPRGVLDQGVDPPPANWTVVEGGHPLPDRGSLQAGEALLEHARSAPEEGALVVGVSGGGSACAEVPRVPVEALRAVTADLLGAGAPVGEVNAVRRALSDLKGGGLARAGPGQVVGLVLSDVVGDRLADVASGPTVPAGRDGGRARRVLEEAGLWREAPASVRDVLAGSAEEAGEVGDAGDVVNRLVGGNGVAVREAAEAARARGYQVRVRERPLEGEAREAGARLAREARDLAREARGPLAYVAGGEAEVTVTGDGTGGPCQELVLGAAQACAGEEVVVGCVATDGVDGPSDAAGGVVDGGTVRRAGERGWEVGEALARNDAGGLLEALGGLLRTGPTGTNVNDVAVVLVP